MSPSGVLLASLTAMLPSVVSLFHIEDLNVFCQIKSPSGVSFNSIRSWRPFTGVGILIEPQTSIELSDNSKTLEGVNSSWMFTSSRCRVHRVSPLGVHFIRCPLLCVPLDSLDPT